MKIDVIIPVYGPTNRLLELFDGLQAQTLPPDRIIVMNTEKSLWDHWEKTIDQKKLPENLSVFHVSKEEFDHGATRDAGISHSDADICLLMTHDAMPADKNLIRSLTDGLLSDEQIAVAYARQLPAKDCRIIERHTRAFNYPEESRIKMLSDLETLGIKTYFCSNVCAAYKREIYEKLGGFIKKTIFNEDMIFAATAMKNGYKIFYVANAKVIHSHNYSAMDQLHRNFDLAVSQADHPEIFAGIRSEGEGIRMVKDTAKWLIKTRHAGLLPGLFFDSGMKYLGYRLGKSYQKLPKSLVLRLTMNRNYWK